MVLFRKFMSVLVKKENKFPDVCHLHLQRDTSIPSRFIQKQAVKTAKKSTSQFNNKKD